MGLRTTPLQRETLYTLHQAAQTYPEIAAHEHVSVECVRYWCWRLKAGGSSHTYFVRSSTGWLA